MLSDFELIQHHFPERQDIKIYPISDVHLGAAEHLTREWELFCQRVKDEPNSYIILGGDLVNNATRNSVSNIFEETMRPREQKKVMVKMLEPLRDKILCAVSGNHERRNRDVDNDITYDIMCKLDLEWLYRENIAFVKIQIGRQNGDGVRNPTYTLVVTHGSGGGILTGGAVNRNERFGYVLDGCDCLVVGHTHKPFVTQPSKIKIDPFNNRVSVQPFKVVSMSSWLGYGGYAAQKMMLPTSHAPQIITLNGKKKQIRVEM
jgi:predicted phosphodiesterase